MRINQVKQLYSVHEFLFLSSFWPLGYAAPWLLFFALWPPFSIAPFHVFNQQPYERVVNIKNEEKIEIIPFVEEQDL